MRVRNHSGTTLGITLAVIVAGLAHARQTPFGTAFTYQGQLKQAGNAVNDSADMRFSLWDSNGGGAPIGSPLVADNMTISEGLFTIELDFGSGAFNGEARWLEIAVRVPHDPTNTLPFTTLAPRQELTAAPNALFALNATAATNATQLNGEPALFYQNASNLNAGTLPSAQLSGVYSNPMTLSNAGNAFTGSGAGLTSLNAGNLTTGTIADARLSANVALLNNAQTFSGGKTFSTAPSFTAAGAPFNVSSSFPVTNLNADFLDGLTASSFLTGIPMPLTLSGNNAGHIIVGENLSTANGAAGIWGNAAASSGSTTGIRGQSNSTAGIGVSGSATAASGLTYGVRAQSNSTSGTAVYGIAAASSGFANGGYFESISPSGTGLQGVASAGSGTTYGVFGRSDSPDGRAVQGLATSFFGPNYGGYFETSSTGGTGVYGLANAATGGTSGGLFVSNSTSGSGVVGYAFADGADTYGVYGFSTSGTGVFGGAGGATQTVGVHGITSSATGIGVAGEAIAATGNTYGGYFNSDSATGTGVYGTGHTGGSFKSDSTGTGVSGDGGTIGVLGHSNSTNGQGVFGWATAATGNTYGVEGVSASTSGAGVYGLASAGNGATFGGRFENASTGGVAVYGLASANSGVTAGVQGFCDSSQGYAGYFVGIGPEALYVENLTFGRGIQAIAPADTAIWGRTTSGIAGVDGWNASTSGRGVSGFASATTGINYGVYGQSNSAAGFDFYAAGAGTNYGAASSRRWKHNIDCIDAPLEKLDQLRGVYFDWDADHGGQHDLGMIAEEVGAVLPEIVQYEDNGTDAIGMDYSKMTPLLVEAIKSLRAEKDDEIASLRAEVAELKALVLKLASLHMEDQPNE